MLSGLPIYSEEAVTAAAYLGRKRRPTGRNLTLFQGGKLGRNVIRICESAPVIAGADEVIKALEQELGIKMGETTADGCSHEFACVDSAVDSNNCK